MPSKRPLVATLLAPVPNTPGVYLFYGTQDELLYVGKSKTLKARVRAHFRDRTERMMMSRVRRIEVRETAGELGALLLESKLIKELKPMFNRAQRQRRRIVIAERRMTPQGYVTVHLRSVDAIDPRMSEQILGVFKHTTQAKEFLEQAVKERRLCPVLLGLEQGRRVVGEVGSRNAECGMEKSRGRSQKNGSGRSGLPQRHSEIPDPQSEISKFRPCFSYHLGRCAGACIGEELPADYNGRVEEAFGERRILAWPYGGPLVIREKRQRTEIRGQRSDAEEVFLVDNWVLVGSLTKTGGRYAPFVPGSHRFDYDTYKIILGFVHAKKDGLNISVVDDTAWNRFMEAATPKKVRM